MSKNATVGKDTRASSALSSAGPRARGASRRVPRYWHTPANVLFVHCIAPPEKQPPAVVVSPSGWQQHGALPVQSMFVVQGLVQAPFPSQMLAPLLAVHELPAM
jgi:hypothetical protein